MSLAAMIRPAYANGRGPAMGFALLWWGYLPIALVAVLGLLMTGLTFREVTNAEQQRVQNAFREAARDRILVIEREFEHTLGLVQDLGNFIGASPWIGRREFRKFVYPALKRHGSIQAFEWVPRVLAAERDTFEVEARRSFPKFRITERNESGQLVTAVRREQHFPILYVQPYRDNKEALGFDLASDPLERAALLATAAAGEVQVSDPVDIDKEGMKRVGFVVRLPVFVGSPGSDQEDPGAEAEVENELAGQSLEPRGFAIGIFRVGDIVERALTNLSPGGVDLRIYDLAANGERQLLYYHVSRVGNRQPNTAEDNDASKQSSWEFTRTMNVANRQWTVVSSSIPGRFQADPRSGWIILTGGAAFTALLMAYLATLVGQAARVRRLVDERTEQLVETNTALVKEVTERKRTEEKLRDSEEEFRSLIETALSVVLWLTPDGLIRGFNREAERLYGQSHASVLGKNYLKLFVPERDQARVKSDIKKVLAGEPTRGFENAVIAVDGSERILVWNVDRLLDANGQPRGVIAVGQDITDRKRTESALQELNKTLEQQVTLRTAEAERRARDLEQFAYVVSHDLKAPLRGIGNLAGWLREDLAGKLTEETGEQLMLLKDRVRRMQTLIDGLLEYSRVGAVVGVYESVDTAQLLAETIDSLAPPEGFMIDIAPDMPTLRTDRLQLGQVFANLIGNSIKHHGSLQGHIWLSVRDVGDYYEFSVADDGRGIAPDYHQEVFLMFKSLETKDYGTDTGIGLALVKKIVQEQGGLIKLESAEIPF